MNKYSIFDAHCDTLCRLLDYNESLLCNDFNVDKSRMMQYDSYTQVFACFISPDYYDAPMDRFKSLYRCFKAQDFTGIKPILSLEGGEPVNSLEDVEFLYQCGVKCIALSRNYSNKIAGAQDNVSQGLTEFGKQVVKKMNELGILVDVSHLNDKSFYDVADITSAPIIATHSNSRRLCMHNRNITDEMFNIIKSSGGCVGINLYPLFVNGTTSCDISEVLKHINHFVSMDGINHIGLGCDFDGTDDILPDEIKGCQHLYRLADALKENGYSENDIEKIMHLNFERVFGGN